MKSGSRQAGRGSNFTYNTELLEKLDPRQVAVIESQIQLAKETAINGSELEREFYGEGENPAMTVNKIVIDRSGNLYFVTDYTNPGRPRNNAVYTLRDRAGRERAGNYSTNPRNRQRRQGVPGEQLIVDLIEVYNTEKQV